MPTLGRAKEGPEDDPNADGPYVPQPVKDVGIAFIEWAEKYWGIDKAFEAADKAKDANSESAPWGNYIRPCFINKINELVKNHKPGGLQPGYYQFNLKDKDHGE